MFIRNPFNYDRAKSSWDSGLLCLDPTRTKQSHKDECDINTIVRRFGLTGQLPVSIRPPLYGDFESVTDYHSALSAIAGARESFEALPSDVRDRFHNDPQRLLEFCSDPANLPEARKLGLAVEAITSVTSGVPLPQVPASPPVTPPGVSTVPPSSSA